MERLAPPVRKHHPAGVTPARARATLYSRSRCLNTSSCQPVAWVRSLVRLRSDRPVDIGLGARLCSDVRHYIQTRPRFAAGRLQTQSGLTVRRSRRGRASLLEPRSTPAGRNEPVGPTTDSTAASFLDPVSASTTLPVVLPRHAVATRNIRRSRRHGDRRDRPLGGRVSSFRSNTASATKSGAPLAAALRDAGWHWRGRWRRRSAARPCVICKSLIVPRTRAGAEPGLGSRLRRRVSVNSPIEHGARENSCSEQLDGSCPAPAFRLHPRGRKSSTSTRPDRALSRPDCRQDRELEAELHAGPRRRGVQRFSSRLHGATTGTAAGALDSHSWTSCSIHRTARLRTLSARGKVSRGDQRIDAGRDNPVAATTSVSFINLIITSRPPRAPCGARGRNRVTRGRPTASVNRTMQRPAGGTRSADSVGQGGRTGPGTGSISFRLGGIPHRDRRGPLSLVAQRRLIVSSTRSICDPLRTRSPPRSARPMSVPMFRPRTSRTPPERNGSVGWPTSTAGAA